MKSYIGVINQREAMMLIPQHVLISRQGSDDGVRGFVMVLPHVGESLQMFLDTGKVMRTSAVTHVEQDGAGLVVDTQNSRYRLKPAS